MALKALLLKKQIDTRRKTLEALIARTAELATRQAELEKAIEEATEENQAEVENIVNDFETEKANHDKAVGDLEREIEGLENELAAEEAKQDTTPPVTTHPQTPAENNEERSEPNMNTREVRIPGMSLRDRLANIVTREDVKNYLAEVRTAMKEKRALNNVGLTIPEVLLGLLRETVTYYSKLYRHVTVRQVGGTARMLVMGAVPEAIWTDCCAALNELTLTFNDVEVDCFKVGGFFAVCNATLEDSDLSLATEIVTAEGQAIGIALDKAILYGRNASSTMKMPQGIVSRLAQTAAPSGYSPTARAWADLHTSNIISITAANSTGVKLFQNLLTAFGAAKGKYSRGGLVHVMNEATHTALMAEAMAINAAGAIVTGVGQTMPVIGGTIETLSFLPDNVIISGYFDLYLLAERAGTKFASSEHVRFLQDQTVYKATARYDGTPLIAEAFVAIGIKGTTPNATMSFPVDTANQEENGED